MVTLDAPAPDRTVAGRPHLPAVTAYWLSAALAACTWLAALLALTGADPLPGTAATVGSARGTLAVLALVDVPLLLVSLMRSRRGSARWMLVWLGAVAFAGYNAVVLVVGLSYNRLFLLLVAMLGLSFWTLVLLLPAAERAMPAALPRGLRRWVGGYLVAICALFALAWLRDALPAAASGGLPAGLQGTGMWTNPVQLLDLSISLPAGIVAGTLLWRGRPWGHALSGLMVVMLGIESVSITVDQWFAHLADPAAPVATVYAFAVVSLIGIVPVAALLARTPTGAPARGRDATTPTPSRG